MENKKKKPAAAPIRTFFIPGRADFVPNAKFECVITERWMRLIEQRWICHNQFQQKRNVR